MLRHDNTNSMETTESTQNIYNNTSLSYNRGSSQSSDQKFETLKHLLKNTCLKVMKEDEAFRTFFLSEESAQFGIDYLVEKINKIQKAYNNEVIDNQEKQMEEMHKMLSGLKEEIEMLTQSNLDLQEKLNLESLEHNQNMQEKMNELEKRMQLILVQKEEIEVENCELEDKMRSLTKEFEIREDRYKEKMKDDNKEAKRKTEMMEEKMSNLENYKFKCGLEQSDFSRKIEDKDKLVTNLTQEIEKLNLERKEIEEMVRDKEERMEEERNMFIEAQKSLKKIEYERNELISSRKRKEKAHDEELELLNKKIEEMEINAVKKTKDKEYKEHIRILEQKFQEIKNNSRMSIHKLEEVEFENGQLKETIVNTKQELIGLGDKMSEIRKDRHHMELGLIESKDKVSELLMQNSGLIEDLGKTQQEVEYIKKQYSETDATLKVERRKAASLERELDQCKFTVSTLEKNSHEVVNSLREQSVHLKKEISSLENRLERQLRESQRKIDEERKISMDAVEKLRILENSEESLRVTVENLVKKVQFFKEKSLEACGTPQRYNKGKNVKMRDSSSTKTLLKQRRPSQQGVVNTKMSNLALKFRHLKDNYKKEKYQISQQMQIFKNSLRTGLKMLIIHVNKQNIAFGYIQRELAQAKKDLKRYQNAMTEGEVSDIRISSKRYYGELSKKDKLSTQSFCMKGAKLGYDDIKAGVHSISVQHQNYQNNLSFLQEDSSNKQSPSLAYSNTSPHEQQQRSSSKRPFDHLNHQITDSAENRTPFGNRKESEELERDSAAIRRRMAELRNKRLVLRENRFGYDSEIFSSNKPKSEENNENDSRVHNREDLIRDNTFGRDDKGSFLHDKYYGDKDDYFSNYASKHSYIRSSFDSGVKRSGYGSEEDSKVNHGGIHFLR